MEMQKCSICKQQYYGYGNNARPINDGRCCGECNDMVVIPARMKAMDMLFPSKQTKEAEDGMV